MVGDCAPPLLLDSMLRASVELELGIARVTLQGRAIGGPVLGTARSETLQGLEPAGRSTPRALAPEAPIHSREVY